MTEDAGIKTGQNKYQKIRSIFPSKESEDQFLQRFN